MEKLKLNNYNLFSILKKSFPSFHFSQDNSNCNLHDHKKYWNFHKSLFLYFTNWILVLTIFHKITVKYLNLLFLSTVVLIGGTYIFYVNPSSLPIIRDNEVVVFQGIQKHIIHFIFHVIPFVFILYKYGKYFSLDYPSDSRFIASFLLIAIYMFLVNFINLYFLYTLDLYYILLLISFGYVFLVLYLRYYYST